MSAVDSFFEFVSKAAGKFKAAPPKKIVLIHHNDSDGISSGLALMLGFESLGLSVSSFCLEKPYPLVLSKIFDQVTPEAAATTVVFSDFGSGMLTEIAKVNHARFRVLVLDHHLPETVIPESIELINCLQFKIPGSDCSASSLAAAFTLALDPTLLEVSGLAVLGAFGDGLIDKHGKFSGVNARMFEAALKHKVISVSPNAMCFPRWQNATTQEITQATDALGAFGYFQGGVAKALAGLRQDCGGDFFAVASQLRGRFEALLAPLLRSVSVHSGGKLCSVTLGPEFADFGVKTVGLVCERIRDQHPEAPSRYIAGFQPIPNFIPGLGEVHLNQVKVSMRVGRDLAARVGAGTAAPLTDILPAATRLVGGFVDACHPLAAATAIPVGTETKFLAELEVRTC